jgi:hypothetical protein
MAVGDHTAAGFGRDPAAGRLLGVGAAGAAVAVGLGVYASVHDPPGDLAITLGFSAPISMKVWLATAAVGFAVVQLITALWMYGRLPVREAPAGLGSVHRISGRLAFLASLPVAYHCLYQLGFQDSTARVLIHSLLGCAFYGAFVTKVLVVRSHRLPGIALPIAGGLTFMLLVGVWLTSAFWYATDTGFPSP